MPKTSQANTQGRKEIESKMISRNKRKRNRLPVNIYVHRVLQLPITLRENPISESHSRLTLMNEIKRLAYCLGEQEPSQALLPAQIFGRPTVPLFAKIGVTATTTLVVLLACIVHLTPWNETVKHVPQTHSSKEGSHGQVNYRKITPKRGSANC